MTPDTVNLIDAPLIEKSWGKKNNSSVAVDISVSVVSHLQIGLVVALLKDLDLHCGNAGIEVILTLNSAEKVSFALDEFSYPLTILRNAIPLGFGANHNKALKHASGRYLCVCNPDIRLNGDPFAALIACFDDPKLGVAAPLVLNSNRGIEVSARRFPSPFTIFCKLLGARRGADYEIKEAPIRPDWVAGMFMLFPYCVFERLRGFDERYFLYYEDVDLCARLRALGYEVALCPKARVVHFAQRTSHRNLKYASWHLRSMTRFFLSPVYRRVRSICHS